MSDEEERKLREEAEKFRLLAVDARREVEQFKVVGWYYPSMGLIMNPVRPSGALDWSPVYMKGEGK